MELNEEFKKNNITLEIIPKEIYREKIIETLKALDGVINKMCYFCISNPYSFVLNNLKKNEIKTDNYFFIDTLTKNVQNPPEAANCNFVSAPNALTEISVAFSSALSDQKCDGAVFDTISAFLVYEKAHSIIQFLHNIITKLRVSGGKAVFIVLKDDKESELVKDLYMFVDNVIEIDK